jgi:L-threonylcarbamoyladenylate synthase
MLAERKLMECTDALKEGKVILYPTDTIWGLGCDPWDEEAVERIYRIKNRKRDQPLLLLVDSLDMLRQYVESIHPRIETLLAFHERPLTLIYPNPKNLPDYLLASDGSIGIRICQSKICCDLIRQFGKPITSTSPNVSGTPAPEHFGEIQSDILSKVEYVLWQPNLDELMGKATPSVIAKFDESGVLEFLRQ